MLPGLVLLVSTGVAWAADAAAPIRGGISRPPGAETHADLRLDVTVPTSTLAVGQRTVFRFAVSNQGPARAYHVSLTVPVPAGLKLIGARISQGTCVPGANLSCALEAVKPEQSIRVSVELQAVVAGEATVAGTVSSRTPDPDLGNNTAAVAAAVR